MMNYRIEVVKNKFIGVDYKILSIEYFDEGSNLVVPIERKYGLKIDDIIEKSRKKGLKPAKYLSTLLDEEEIYESSSPNLVGEDFQAVKVKRDLIDYNLIVDCGLGLIQFYDGSYYIYNAYNDKALFKPTMDMYMSIVDSNFYSLEMDDLIKNGKAENMINQFKMSEFNIYSTLVKSYSNKKSNIIEFDFKGRNE